MSENTEHLQNFSAMTRDQMEKITENELFQKPQLSTRMNKIFKVAQVRDLLNQVHNEKISFSRFVEILNEIANKNL